MKKILIAALILLSTVHLKIQTGLNKGKLYFQVIASPTLLSQTVKTDMNFDVEKVTVKETRLRKEFGKPVKLNPLTDAMHYIERLGLIFINAFPVKMDDNEVCHLDFSKPGLKVAS